MSNPDQLPEQQPANEGGVERATKPPGRARKIRQRILFSILAAMLIALVYDYFIARPSVDAAYERITVMNEDYNASTQNPMTNEAVQTALSRKPSRVFTEGPYEVEVYSWRSGLPYRTYDYFVVYTGSDYLAGIVGKRWTGKMTFLTHFKYEIPEKELSRRPPRWKLSVSDEGP